MIHQSNRIKETDMKNKEEKEWFEFHEIPPALAELYHYFDKRILRYRIIITILLVVIVALLFK